MWLNSLFFFFSSRRRHTRFDCDWSSDVCSSDLIRPNLSPQLIDGLTSTSEWSGVPLALLFREVGVKPGAKWFLAEGDDAAVMSRSIPMEKAWDDALIAYGQNGEALRPEQGDPARLFLPGWEGNADGK